VFTDFMIFILRRERGLWCAWSCEGFWSAISERWQWGVFRSLLLIEQWLFVVWLWVCWFCLLFFEIWSFLVLGHFVRVCEGKGRCLILFQLGNILYTVCDGDFLELCMHQLIL